MGTLRTSAPRAATARGGRESRSETTHGYGMPSLKSLLSSTAAAVRCATGIPYRATANFACFGCSCPSPGEEEDESRKPGSRLARGTLITHCPDVCSEIQGARILTSHLSANARGLVSDFQTAPLLRRPPGPGKRWQRGAGCGAVPSGALRCAACASRPSRCPLPRGPAPSERGRAAHRNRSRKQSSRPPNALPS